MQVHPWGPPKDFQGRRTTLAIPQYRRCSTSPYSLRLELIYPRGYPIRLRILGTCKNDGGCFMVTQGRIPPKKRTMASAEVKRNRDRWEADLLLNVVFAHMAFRSTKDYREREAAHYRFKDAIRQLHQFVTAENSAGGVADTLV